MTINNCPLCGSITLQVRILDEYLIECSHPDCDGIDWDSMPWELVKSACSLDEAIQQWNRAAALTALEVAA